MFITFEGPDGSGKSTQIGLLTTYLQAQGRRVYRTREPGGTSIGDQIRDVLHNVNNTEMRPVTEILLYSASRAQLVAQVIEPMLAEGYTVLCDRYADSTYAYQGYGRQLDMAMLQRITQFATQNLKPDLTIYLDLPVADGLMRKRKANDAGEGELNRMDRQAAAFYERVRQGYLQMAQTEADRWRVIDARQSVEQIHRQICAAVERVK
ncbi:MAG TPA: dTMP kinase [Anaerolineae bacterium]|nr:dTMP kinase [Anaerolineae bacterium]